MKRIIALSLAACLAFGLTACGASAGNATQSEAVSAAPAETSEAPAATSEAPAETSEAPPAETSAAPAERTDGLPAYTGGEVELRFGWWGNDERAEITNKVIDLFHQAYPEITVKGEPNGGTSDHFQIVDTQIQGGNAPDLIQFGGNYPDYQQYLLSLNDYIGSQLLIDSHDLFDQTALIPATLDGNLYVVSLGTNTLVLAYNKTMIEAAGVALPSDNMSWDELKAYGEELKDKLPAGVFPFVDNSTNQANYLSYYLRQEGTPLWTSNDGGKSYATEENLTKWLQLWADWRAAGLAPDADTTATYAETGADTSAIVAGKAAIGMLWSNQVAGYQAAMTDTLGAVTLPSGGEKSYAIQMSQYIGVNKDSANLEAAVLFANFFVTSPKAGAILGTNRGVPCSPVVRQAISANATELDAAVYRIYDAVADRAIPQDPNLPNDQEFVNELLLIGQNVGFGTSTVEQGGKDILALIERLAQK
ncbi:MAG: extracellular solute-binding protein [Clostridiales bacterium]|jgi:multiple sugar transport system substrate-binding protein|nr:extracellular solute-binding protein [Clostridiales bacterium]